MGLDLTTVASINPPQYRGGQAWISWIPTTPGLTWQVYVDATLAWWGTETGTWLVLPPGAVDRVVIGSVDPADEATDFGASLPAAPARRFSVSWSGGTFEAPDTAGFNVYMSPAAGAAIDYSRPVAAIPMEAGVATGTYGWTSPTLASGLWGFAVRPYDAAGNLGTPAVIAGTVGVPPAEPPPFADGSRLHYAVNDAGLAPATEPTVTLSWNPSAG